MGTVCCMIYTPRYITIIIRWERFVMIWNTFWAEEEGILRSWEKKITLSRQEPKPPPRIIHGQKPIFTIPFNAYFANGWVRGACVHISCMWRTYRRRWISLSGQKQQPPPLPYTHPHYFITNTTETCRPGR